MPYIACVCCDSPTEIRDFGNGHLHFRCQCVATNPRVELIVAGTRFQMSTIDLGQQLAAGEFAIGRYLACRKQIVDRDAFAAHHNALMAGRKKTVAPVDRSARRQTTRIGNHDVGRQIVGLGSHPVGHPGPEGRKTVQTESGVLLKRRRRVVRRLAEHRPHDCQFIRNAAKMRKQIGNPEPAFAPLLELPLTLPQQADLPKNTSGFSSLESDFPCSPFQFRFVVERVDLAESAEQADMNDSRGARREMGAGSDASGSTRAAATFCSRIIRSTSATLPTPRAAKDSHDLRLDIVSVDIKKLVAIEQNATEGGQSMLLGETDKRIAFAGCGHTTPGDLDGPIDLSGGFVASFRTIRSAK